jgi:hypothetical protein
VTFGSTLCRAQVQESNPSTSIQTQQTGSFGMGSSPECPHNRGGTASRVPSWAEILQCRRAETGKYVRFAKEGHAGRLTLFSPIGTPGSSESAHNVLSTSMGCGPASPCNVSLFSELSCLLAILLGLG